MIDDVEEERRHAIAGQRLTLWLMATEGRVPTSDLYAQLGEMRRQHGDRLDSPLYQRPVQRKYQR